VKHAVHLPGPEATCTFHEQSRLPKGFGGGSRTSKDPCGPADISALLPNAGWLSFHVRSHPREVGRLSPWDDVALRLNPYPAHYRPAFACSLVLYPQPHGLALRFAVPDARWGVWGDYGLTTFPPCCRVG
jgi:hypothetical protein